MLWQRNNRRRELAPLFREHHGGFVIDRIGVVAAAGVYFDAPATSKLKVTKGLGSRHMAEATALTKSLAIVISESSGTVTVFWEGTRVLSLGG